MQRRSDWSPSDSGKRLASWFGRFSVPGAQATGQAVHWALEPGSLPSDMIESKAAVYLASSRIILM